MFSSNFSKSAAGLLAISVAAIGVFQFTHDDNEAGQVGVIKAQLASTPPVAILPVSALGANIQSGTITALPKKDMPSVQALAENLDALFAQKDPNPRFDTFHDRYQSTLARRPNMEIDPQALFIAAQSPTAWEESEEVGNSSSLPTKYREDGRAFIKLSPLKLESLSTGDKLDIEIFETGVNFTATINDVRSDGTGQSVTWSGTSDAPGSTETITITQGSSLTVGGIFTDQGLYQLEVKNGQGYIVSSATLFRHGQDQQVQVPQHLIESPPEHYVKLDAETFGE